MTQRTTLPFLIAESGAASFTLAVMTSPRPARSPRSPPRGNIHDSRRAPELSATSRIVRIPIIRNSSGFYIQFRRATAPPPRPPHDSVQSPPLQLAQRPAFDDPHDVAHLRLGLFVMGI